MMEDGHGWAKRKMEVCFGEKSSPVAGHPAINLIGFTVPASSDQQKSQNMSRISLFSSSGFFELSFAGAFISKWL
jgi:hypothetical protein